ncbi:DUF4062 domain-containing protein [Clavibacter sp. VKM Ac-2873]|uniref:DUF4062 domain-containing protein n=1 Tax=Clavibacter sp. VKM Ac-2873 TaxID=2783813 RepID=UPI00188A648E|nr:DUF4062 domain-containing protein [Clavibacter sp. VKM Ac-2873]
MRGDQQVFVSSLIADMPEERRAVREAIEECGATPVMFEDLGGQDVSADRAYLAGVRRSTSYVGLFGNRDGVRIPDGYSATHAEFREAEKEGLRLCVFVNGEDGSGMDGSQRDLIAGTRNPYTTSSWSSVDDLKMRVKGRLMDLAGEEIAPLGAGGSRHLPRSRGAQRRRGGHGLGRRSECPSTRRAGEYEGCAARRRRLGIIQRCSADGARHSFEHRDLDHYPR